MKSLAIASSYRIASMSPSAYTRGAALPDWARTKALMTALSRAISYEGRHRSHHHAAGLRRRAATVRADHSRGRRVAAFFVKDGDFDGRDVAVVVRPGETLHQSEALSLLDALLLQHRAEIINRDGRADIAARA